MKHSLFLYGVAVLLLLTSCNNNPVLSWQPAFENNKQPFASGICREVFLLQQEDSLSSDDVFVTDTVMPVSEEAFVRTYADTVVTDDSLALVFASENIPPYLLAPHFDYSAQSIQYTNNVFFLAMNDTCFASEADVARFRVGGYNTMHAAEFQGNELVAGDYFNVTDFVEQYNSGSLPIATITLPGLQKRYYLPKAFCSRYFKDEALKEYTSFFGVDSCKTDVLAYADGKPIAIRITNAQNGCVTLVSTPLLFSNYALAFNKWQLVGAVVHLARMAGFSQAETGKSHLLAPVTFAKPFQIDDEIQHLYRTPVHSDSKASQSSVGAGDLLSAIYRTISKTLIILLLGVLLCLLVRRRQTIIPIFQGYRNRTAEYVNQVALLYYNEGDFAHILRNKVVYFFHEVNERQHIRLSEHDCEHENAIFLAAALGVNLDLTNFVRDCNRALERKLVVDKEILASMSEKMNVIVRILRGEKAQDDLLKLYTEN